MPGVGSPAHEAYDLRPLVAEDRPLLPAFLEQNLDWDRLSAELLREKLWDDPRFSPRLNWLAVRGDRPLGVILGVGGEPGFVKLMAVAADQRNRGIGTALLKKLEIEARAMGTTEMRLAESAPLYLWPGLDVRYTRALVFFERKGYRRVGQTYNMSAPLSALEPLSPTLIRGLERRGIFLERAAESDRAAVCRWLRGLWPSWEAELLRSFAHRPACLHLARLGREPIGFAAYHPQNPSSGGFGPMGVDPRYRGFGIGGCLLKGCLHDLKRLGFDDVVIPWVGPLDFYVHHAHAHVSRVFFRYEKKL